ncbi:MAG: hypothetical protein AAGG75_01505 [Bacteroidota bacterium]
MRARSKTFLRNLDEAVIEHRRITCPNVDCHDIIVSKETVQSEKHSILEYQCVNPKCSYHAKRKILLTHAEQPPKIELANEVSQRKSSWTANLLGLVTVNIGPIAATLKALFER